MAGGLSTMNIPVNAGQRKTFFLFRCEQRLLVLGRLLDGSCQDSAQASMSPSNGAFTDKAFVAKHVAA